MTNQEQIIPYQGKVIHTDSCKLGEGITYDPITDTLWWFDILGHKLYEWQVSQEKSQIHDMSFLGSSLARIDDTRQLIAADCGLMIRDVASNSYSLYRIIDDNPQTRANDGRMHQSGCLWTSRMGRNAEEGLGAIYHVNASTTTLLFANITIPNAICFSPDGGTGYFVDTQRNALMRVDLDSTTGLPVGEPAILQDEAGTDSGIDGAVCDAEGLIWAARWGAGAVDVFAPDGTKLRRYKLPTPQVTCPAFFGRKANRLALTTAWEGMDETTQQREMLAGQTFELGIEVNGRYEANFILNP